MVCRRHSNFHSIHQSRTSARAERAASCVIFVVSSMASSPSASPVKPVRPVPLPLLPLSATAVVLLPRRAAPAALLAVPQGKARRGAGALLAASAVVDDDPRPAIDEYPEGILSGEWPDNFSLLSYADLRAYLESQQIVTPDKMSPTAMLGDVMSRPVQVVTPGQQLWEIDAFFAAQSGLPVVDDEGRCVGVVSTKDKAKASKGMESTVGEVMSSPAITIGEDRLGSCRIHAQGKGSPDPCRE